MAIGLPKKGKKTVVPGTPSFDRLYRRLYKLSYLTGEKAVALGGTVARSAASIFNVALSELFKGAGNFARNLSGFKRSRAGRGEISFTRAVISAGAGIGDTLQSCREAFERGGVRSGFAVAGRVLRRAAGRFFSSKKAAFNYLAPLATVAVLAFTIYFWSNACFGVSVSYDGKNLGVVGSEKVYRDAADKVEQNVSEASGSNFKLDSDVSFKMVLAKKSNLSDEDQIYNNIVTKSCDGVKTGYGLYVDSRLAGANPDGAAIEAMLNGLTSKYKDDPQVQSVGFVQDVEIKDGVFPSSVFKSVGDIKDTVTGKGTSKDSAAQVRAPGAFRVSLDPLYAMNLSSTTATVDRDDSDVTDSDSPMLTVKLVKNEVYMQKIPFKVEKTDSAKLDSGKTQVAVAGRNGKLQVVAAVTYVDGTKTDEDTISSITTQQPVTEKVLVGTKKATPKINRSENSYYGSGSDSSPYYGGSSSYSGGLIGYARSAIGVPYVPDGGSFSGFDCSGFTSYVFSRYGVSLPHSAAGQSAYGSYVSRSSLKAGDLVFFDTNGGHSSITHVGIYIGGGSFIDASSSRPHSVTIDNINSNYYSSRYMTARRVLK